MNIRIPAVILAILLLLPTGAFASGDPTAETTSAEPAETVGETEAEELSDAAPAASAEPEEPRTDGLGGTCGSNAKWTLDASGLLTVYGSGYMEDYFSDSEIPWAAYRSQILRVEIKGSVTIVGRIAFWKCPNLETVVIYSPVKAVHALAFAYDTALTEVILPGTVTSISSDSFFDCPISVLRYLGAEAAWKTMGVTDISTSKLRFVTDKGDANLDGRRNAKDLAAMMNVLTAGDTTSYAAIYTDYNEDGGADIRDIVSFMKYLAANPDSGHTHTAGGTEYTERVAKGTHATYNEITRCTICGEILTSKTHTENDLSKIPAACLTVNGKKYYLGQSASSLGTPSEKLTGFLSGAQLYVYNTSSYNGFFVAGVKNGVVVYLSAAGKGFTYQGMSCGTRVGSYKTTEGLSLSVAVDTNDNRIVHAVQICTGEAAVYGNENSSTEAAEAKLIFYYTNAFRVYHGLSVLAWNSVAARAAQLHSQDMADRNYFGHYGKYNESNPSQRVTAQGNGTIYNCGENIHAGALNGYGAYCAWVQSSGHRENMLRADYTSVGVGVGYNAGSNSEHYYTQDFVL